MFWSKFTGKYSWWSPISEKFRSTCMEVFCTKNVPKRLAKFTGKHLCWSLLIKLPEKLQHWCLLLNFAKSLRNRAVDIGGKAPSGAKMFFYVKLENTKFLLVDKMWDLRWCLKTRFSISFDITWYPEVAIYTENLLFSHSIFCYF